MQRAALATFPIYLMHYSCLQFFTALSIAFSGHVYGLAVGLSSLAVGVIATPCAERLKRALRASLEQFRPA
jgi:peptidoglycan/LPS O-acetylase OafA/YrhL